MPDEKLPQYNEVWNDLEKGCLHSCPSYSVNNHVNNPIVKQNSTLTQPSLRKKNTMAAPARLRKRSENVRLTQARYAIFHIFLPFILTLLLYHNFYNYFDQALADLNSVVKYVIETIVLIFTYVMTVIIVYFSFSLIKLAFEEAYVYAPSVAKANEGLAKAIAGLAKYVAKAIQGLAHIILSLLLFILGLEVIEQDEETGDVEMSSMRGQAITTEPASDNTMAEETDCNTSKDVESGSN
ncbi:Schizosaccharomyces specific protein [Schizosaccharomyces pombe]|uniref:Uncharacterized membrane protein C1682.06 n=1 Tax=Schizosaccharomyces pombe (strain 972 / ATCC 24843) TaxID=284812 RepID=YJE6_SCHPO|nr:uncharacterized protein SPCC1682.06 [Schizosaccharomyces pombe]O74437.1 RecName: Full=Uncharacterized membrane protein C1682.06 [Schizosaccharomyces pombe 972h-]CAA20672.1 sequence orphan [Schizosaccharomyces pombe]|eukprot:NP_587799.1 uncharacterized protein SPCC1682.06 [Schizosaccharomyces pombe]